MTKINDDSQKLTLTEIVSLSDELENACLKLRNLGISLSYLEKQGGYFALVSKALLEVNKVESVEELLEPLIFAIGYLGTSTEILKEQAVQDLNKQIEDEE